MPYLNLDLDYFDHPKTLRLIGLLGKGAAELPIRLWCKAGKHHSEDGNLTGYSAQEIESLVGWWGKSGKCVEAFVRIGFVGLLQGSDGYSIHDWTDHNGHIHALNARAKAAAKARWDKMRNQALLGQCLGDAPSVPFQTTESGSEDRGLQIKALIASTAEKKCPKKP